MVHETVLHQWDAHTMTATPPPLDPAISADSVDELMSVGTRFRADGPAVTCLAGSISFLAVDTAHVTALLLVVPHPMPGRSMSGAALH